MKIRPFELTLLVIFAVMAIGALVVIKILPPGDDGVSEEEFVGAVQIWGTVPSSPVISYLKQLAELDEAYTQITYRHIPQENFIVLNKAIPIPEIDISSLN